MILYLKIYIKYKMAESYRKDIIFIIDESGSMSSMGKEPIHSINNFVKEQTLANKNGTFTLYKFNNKVNLVYNNIPLAEVPIFEDYNPSNMTALHDAIGIAITTKKTSDFNKNVTCVILTDGHENSSQTYTRKDVKNMVSDMETNFGWTFMYLGANQDSVYEGDKVGISCCSNFLPTPQGICEITRQISQSISSNRSGKNPILIVDTNL
jgi:hypothetical protein